MTEAKKPVKGALVVSASLVTVKDSNGAVRYLSRGDVVPDGTSQVSVDHLVSLGYVSEEK